MVGGWVGARVGTAQAIRATTNEAHTFRSMWWCEVHAGRSSRGLKQTQQSCMLPVCLLTCGSPGGAPCRHLHHRAAHNRDDGRGASQAASPSGPRIGASAIGFTRAEPLGHESLSPHHGGCAGLGVDAEDVRGAAPHHHHGHRSKRHRARQVGQPTSPREAPMVTQEPIYPSFFDPAFAS